MYDNNIIIAWQQKYYQSGKRAQWRRQVKVRGRELCPAISSNSDRMEEGDINVTDTWHGRSTGSTTYDLSQAGSQNLEAT